MEKQILFAKLIKHPLTTPELHVEGVLIPSLTYAGSGFWINIHNNFCFSDRDKPLARFYIMPSNIWMVQSLTDEEAEVVRSVNDVIKTLNM